MEAKGKFFCWFLARIYLKLGKVELSEVQYHKLLADNSENVSYLDNLEAVRGLAGGEITFSNLLVFINPRVGIS